MVGAGQPARGHDDDHEQCGRGEADDDVPQALVLTAIVISFATTALFLVVIMASRGLTGTDHVDGKERSP